MESLKSQDNLRLGEDGHGNSGESINFDSNASDEELSEEEKKMKATILC